VRVEVATPPDTPPLRDALLAAGIPVFEGDVRFAMRYLIDRGLRGSIGLTGEGRAAERGTIRPGCPAAGCASSRTRRSPPPTGSPRRGALHRLARPRDRSARRADFLRGALLGGRRRSGVGAAGTGAAGSGAPEGGDEVLLALPEERVTRALAGASLEGRVVPCGDERGLLKTLGERLCALDFDILTGWNVIDFDLSVLVAAAQRLGVPLEIGRAPGAARVVRDTSFWGRSRAEITGRRCSTGSIC